MIDHMTIGIRDFERSMTFYDAALAPLGVSRLVTLTPCLLYTSPSPRD